jgi:hypothetical protein
MMSASKSLDDHVRVRAEDYPSAPTALTNYSLAPKSAMHHPNESSTTISKYFFPSIKKMMNNNS